MGKINFDFEACKPGTIYWVDESTYLTGPRRRVRPQVFRVQEGLSMKQQEWRYLFWVEDIYDIYRATPQLSVFA